PAPPWTGWTRTTTATWCATPSWCCPPSARGARAPSTWIGWGSTFAPSAARCRDVVRVPYDPHLEEGAEVELEQLSAATTEAYLHLSATVGDGFAWPRRTVNRGASA